MTEREIQAAAEVTYSSNLTRVLLIDDEAIQNAFSVVLEARRAEEKK